MADGIFARIGRFFGIGSTPSRANTEDAAQPEREPERRRYSGHLRFHDFRRDFLAEEGRTPGPEEAEAENDGDNGQNREDRNVFSQDEIGEKFQPIKAKTGTLTELPSEDDSATETAPIFETHASFQTTSFGTQHSFIGLRYSKRVGTSIQRKRIAVGFGAGDGGPVGFNTPVSSRGSNRLMDDSGHHASASTQTKITKLQANNLLDAIPRFSDEFNYNVFGTNCNHFTRTMAKIVGASMPSELHQTKFGPLTAKLYILNAGTGNDKTQIFYRNQGGTSAYPDKVEEFIPWVKDRLAIANEHNPSEAIQDRFEGFIRGLNKLNTYMKVGLNILLDYDYTETCRDVFKAAIECINGLMQESKKLNIVGNRECNELGIMIQAFLKSLLRKIDGYMDLLDSRPARNPA